jgi:AraC-type DNA-binding domain-containing proteins
MSRNIRIQLIVTSFVLMTFVPSLVFGQGKGAQSRDLNEHFADSLYQKGQYKEACEHFKQAAKINHNIKSSRLEITIFLFFLIDALGVFLFLYLEKQRAYKNLVKQNMQWANRMSAIDTLSKQNQNTIEYKEQSVLNKLIDSFAKDKIYLQSDITINELAKTLGTTRSVLSKIINTYFQKNFSSLLNEYRIKEAIKLLTDPKTQNYKLEAIAQMCGYNNRQVFHVAFKKETSLTPLDFKELSNK